MGGSVKVAVRLEDGTVHADVRWTNTLNWWLHSPRLIDEPDALLREYLDNPSSYKTGDTTLTPTGYGLVIIDAVTKSVYSYQDYSTFGKTSVAGIWLANDEDLVGLQELRNRGLLSVTDVDGKPTHHFTGLTPLSIKEEAELARVEIGSAAVVITMSPWTLEQSFFHVPYETLEYLEGQGFPVTEADKAAWAEWAAEHKKLYPQT